MQEHKQLSSPVNNHVSGTDPDDCVIIGEPSRITDNEQNSVVGAGVATNPLSVNTNNLSGRRVDAAVSKAPNHTIVFHDAPASPTSPGARGNHKIDSDVIGVDGSSVGAGSGGEVSVARAANAKMNNVNKGAAAREFNRQLRLSVVKEVRKPGKSEYIYVILNKIQLGCEFSKIQTKNMFIFAPT